MGLTPYLSGSILFSKLGNRIVRVSCRVRPAFKTQTAVVCALAYKAKSLVSKMSRIPLPCMSRQAFGEQPVSTSQTRLLRLRSCSVDLASASLRLSSPFLDLIRVMFQQIVGSSVVVFNDQRHANGGAFSQLKG